MWQVAQLAERRRSMSIRLYGLDCPWEDVTRAEFDEIARLAREVTGSDGSEVNLMVDDIQMTVATSAIRTGPLERSISVCSTALNLHASAEVVEFPDMRLVPELAHNPFVDGTLEAVRFYAAAPLVGKHGLALGTLCVWSEQPRRLDEQQRSMLRQLGRAVVNLLDERRRALVPDVSGALRPAR